MNAYMNALAIRAPHHLEWGLRGRETAKDVAAVRHLWLRSLWRDKFTV